MGMKIGSRLIGYLLLLYFCLAVGGCEEAVTAESHKISAPAVATIRIIPEDLQLYQGQSMRLSVTLGDAAGNMLPIRKFSGQVSFGSEVGEMATIADSTGRKGRRVFWLSSQPDVVSIDSQGRLTALKIGVAQITAESEGCRDTVSITVTKPQVGADLFLTPVSATVSVGDKVHISVTSGHSALVSSLQWKTSQLSHITVGNNGMVSALSPGEASVQVYSGAKKADLKLLVTPAKLLYGLDFPGNAGVSRTLRFEFRQPLNAFPATYIWRLYPRQQQSYYSSFFWGNNGSFYPEKTFYGFHPYPDWNTSYQQFWEIAAPPGSDYVSSEHVVYDRWYLQVAIVREIDNQISYEYFWDWPDVSKVLRYTSGRYEDPPMPVLTVGDAPWNPGNEVLNGLIRGLQFYDSALTLDDISQEIEAPGSIRKPWYLNLNPTPDDILDNSGNDNHPVWVGGERPRIWKGLESDGIIRPNLVF